MSAASPRLGAFGWTAWHAALYRRALEDGGADPERCRPARVATVIRHLARLVTGDGETTAFVPGKMRATAPPVVGDWVVLEAPEGAEPVVVLTKADLLDADELAHRREAVEGAAPGVSVFAVSSPRREGLEPLRHYLAEGRTVVLLGSSGAGKSTLLNTLVGEEVMRTAAVREGDDRGRHTTSHRELVPLPGGGLLIDGPGIREVQLWVDEDDAALGEAFADVEALAAACRFRDCTHRNEPGCAVREAVEAGDLDEPRLDSYRRLQHEMEVLERRKDTVADRKFFKKQGALYKRILAEKKERE
jgi:ribosome biogenesis GTPase